MGDSSLTTVHQRLVPFSGGGEVAAYRWGDPNKPALLFHHATGFAGGIWETLIEELADNYCLIAYDARGHGKTSIPCGRVSWELFGDDLLEIATTLTGEFGVSRFRAVVGHSLGGTAAMYAAARNPRVLPHVLALDPVVLPPEDPGGRSRFSLRTRVRRSSFASREEARETLLADPIFERWDPRVFESYLHSSFLELPDGSFRLACLPELEASIYELGATPVWSGDERCRLDILYSPQSRFLNHYSSLKRKHPSVGLSPIEAGHLIPQEAPDGARRWIESHLRNEA